ncbi:MAG: FAD-dependent oxidoreductase [Chloroflexi bacterium]|nr:FAD-dependent oxidoreductase [Chloroflexota bacterium]
MIGNLRVKNRIIRSPQHTALGGRDGSVTDRLLRHYEEFARGGCGLVIVEYAYTDKKASKAANCQLSVADNECIPGLALLAQRIKDNGAKAALQIGHCGRQKMLGIPPLKSASRVPWEELLQRVGPVAVPEELTVEELQEIVETHGDAALRVQKAGFDMVEVHGAHGYLITNFLSPRTNKRTDWFGGSLENRMRFLVEVVKNIRAKVGPDFPLSVRLDGSEYEPDGVMIEDTIQVARTIASLGVNLIHMSGGNHHQIVYEVSPMGMPHGIHVWAAEAVKKAVPVPVVASGSITMPALAEEILAAGKADFIGLARPLLADPYWPQKALVGRVEDIKPCIRCNEGCRQRGPVRSNPIRCTVNVALGKEAELRITPAETRKKVAVIGGGPAGMETAIVCVRRGHQVTIYEKRRLGGALLEASVLDCKEDISPLIVHYLAQVGKLGIKVINEAADLETIKSGGFDAVVVAVGGSPLRPKAAGLDRPNVVTALEVLDGKSVPGQRVMVIGAGIVGVEVGLFLAEQGKEVALIKRRDEFLSDVEQTNRTFYLQQLSKYNIKLYTGKRLEAVVDGSIVVVDRLGRTESLDADSVVLATGFAPQTALAEQLERETDLEVYAVGDCVSPRLIFDAIHEGHLAALRI